MGGREVLRRLRQEKADWRRFIVLLPLTVIYCEQLRVPVVFGQERVRFHLRWEVLAKVQLGQLVREYAVPVCAAKWLLSRLRQWCAWWLRSPQSGF